MFLPLWDLDSPVIKYFPEYDGDCNDRFVREATVRHLLEMRSPHEKTAFKQISDDDYVKSFFKLKASKVPGTAFSYDTSASHTLCALAEKISGKSLIDFLRDEFLRDLGFSDEAYCLRDPLGRSLGGSGLMARHLDIGIFAHVFLNGGKLWGKLGGKQVISGDYCFKRRGTGRMAGIRISILENFKQRLYVLWNRGAACPYTSGF